MKEIILKKGKGKVLVDDEDYEWLVNFGPWYIRETKRVNYAVTTVKNKKSRNPMHRVIMKKYYVESSLQVDHIDNDGLNNQKNNLRYATKRQNRHNSRKETGENLTSIYKGVKKIGENSFYASVIKDSKQITINSFRTEREAAIAYDIKAREVFGEFSYKNIPDATKEEINKVSLEMCRTKHLRTTASKYRGISKYKGNKWRAVIHIKCKRFHLGIFNNEEEAALAYNKKAIELLGDKAKLNIID